MTQQASSALQEEQGDIGASSNAQRAKIMNHYANATERFLAAWIQAIERIGPEYFECKGIDNFKEATDRDQIRPDWDAIEQRINVCSIGEGIFIGAVMSFFNGKWGAGICNCFGCHGIGDAANRLELGELEIVIELMSSHTGW